jgi:23S rRNA pseudouridine2457 synthase
VVKNKRIKGFRYYLFNKPYGVLCQFTDSGGRPTISRYGDFPGDVYPAGRLDADSEGLVFLTNDGQFKHLLLEPQYGHSRTYIVQVERIPAEASLEKLRKGVLLEGKRTLPARVHLLAGEPDMPPRPVPIRFRKNVPVAWVEITLTEGRNRQVRRMTAAVGHPALRLVRIRFYKWSLEGLKPGDVREISPDEAAPLRNTRVTHHEKP